MVVLTPTHVIHMNRSTLSNGDASSPVLPRYITHILLVLHTDAHTKLPFFKPPQLKLKIF